MLVSYTKELIYGACIVVTYCSLVIIIFICRYTSVYETLLQLRIFSTNSGVLPCIMHDHRSYNKEMIYLEVLPLIHTRAATSLSINNSRWTIVLTDCYTGMLYGCNLHCTNK